MKTTTMKFSVLFSMLFLSFHLFGQVEKVNKSDLIGCWTDSREENKPDSNFMVYRPCDYKDFPPSRFRFKMELKADFTCSWLSLASNDAHGMQQGTWSFNEETSELKLIDKNGNIFKEFVIEQVVQDILKIKK